MNLQSRSLQSDMDFYILLGLERAASVGDIKRAYKRLARKYHPDINPGDRLAAAQFRQIAEAYETLIDPDRRRRYDSTGSAMRAGRAGALRFRGVRLLGQRQRIVGLDLRRSVRGRARPARRAASGSARRARHRSASDDHDRVRSGGSRRPAPADRHAAGALPRRAAARAGSRSPRRAACRAQGVGTVKSARGHMVFSRTCAQCGGTGRQRQLALPRPARASRSKCGPSRSR